MAMFAGIDWGNAYHQVAVVDDDGKECWNRRFVHDRAGLDDLFKALGGVEGLAGVAIERSEGILIDQLLGRGFVVYAVSPRVSARAREFYQAAARKNDRFDAFVLANALRTDGWRWRPLVAASSVYAHLHTVVRHRRQAVETQLMVESQLRETLLAYHPAVIALFSSVDRNATLQFLADYPTPAKAAAVGEARMVGFCQRVGYTGRVPAAELTRRLRDNLLTASDGNVEGHCYAALALAEQLAMLNRQIKDYNKHIEGLLNTCPDAEIFMSFPAVGRITAAELIGEIGEHRDRYPTPQALLAEAGTAPVTLASGKVQRVRIRYACNHHLRTTTTTWAHTLKRIDEPSRARYLAAMNRGASYHTALRGVAASWLRVLWRCWQDNTPYNPQRHRPNT